MNKPTISIIIRTLNEEKYLDQLLFGIKKQKAAPEHEIIVIDSGSTDNTLLIASKYNCKILHITKEDYSFGKSLNQASDHASGKYLVFISGHCIPKNDDWLKLLIDPLRNGSVDYSYGRQLGGADTYWSEKQILLKYFPDHDKIPQSGFYCNNANSAILRAKWEKFKFDEQLTGLEDLALAKKLYLEGSNIGYVAQAEVYHLHHENWSQVKRRFEREALALREICPEVIIKRRDAFRYFLIGIYQDIIANLPHSLALKRLLNSVCYRYHQFSGSYKGNHASRLISQSLRESYFYPAASYKNPLTTKF